MKIVEKTEDRLVIEAGDPVFAWVLLALCVASALTAAIKYLAQPHAISTESFQGLVAAAILFQVGFVAVFERATFVFDQAERTVDWRRLRIFTRRSGLVHFEEVRDVVAQTNGSPRAGKSCKWRIALVLAEEEIPLSVAFAPDRSGSHRALAETIREFIGQPVRSPLPM
ncbi:MAG: hypothetical protein HUU20_14335 [Pirellulales bacterium]|nr:hypothetical protein [Pirellulales bacterium]